MWDLRKNQYCDDVNIGFAQFHNAELHRDAMIMYKIYCGAALFFYNKFDLESLNKSEKEEMENIIECKMKVGSLRRIDYVESEGSSRLF